MMAAISSGSGGSGMYSLRSRLDGRDGGACVGRRAASHNRRPDMLERERVDEPGNRLDDVDHDKV